MSCKLHIASLRLAALLGVALLSAAPAPAQVTTAAVSGGRLEGAIAEGVASFKGVPFAAAPVGALRWQAPQPVRPWSGVRKAVAYGPSCMQAAQMVQMLGAPPGVGEDCLYLNVWTAAKSPAEKRPVMVWIYGGAFAAGMTSAPTYDGAAFAKRGVVLVSIAYRVGPFGFLAHPGLTAEGHGSSGNYGLQDMIAGLGWVKRNIARFGGDPANVTIFGESAGGIAVSMLAAAPPARGLFHRAISESGGSFAPARLANEGGQNVQPLKDAEAFGAQFLARLGANDVAAARALPAERIQGATGGGLSAGFWPNFDGHVLLGDQYLLYSAGKYHDTPVLIGTNSDEGGLFAAPGMTPARFEEQVRAGYGAKADVILAAYPHGDDRQAARAGKDLFRDSVFAWPTWAWATLQSKQNRSKAYVYYFDQRTPQSPEGSNHASELGYVFGTLGAAGSMSGPPTPAQRQISELMMGYWVNFATRGDPNGAGLPTWPAFDAQARQAMVIDASPAARPLPNQPQLAAFETYFAWRREQAAARH